MYQVIMILMLAIGLNNHVILVPLLLHTAGRDAWFAVVLSALPICAVMLILQYVMRLTKQQHIGLWLRDRIPPVVTNALLALMAIPLFLIAAVTLRDTVQWANITFLVTTPSIALVIPLIAVCFYAAYAGIGSIAITSGMLLPLVVFFGFFVMTTNFVHKDFSLLFPLLEYGWTPVFRGIFYAMSGLSEIFALVLLQHYIKTQVRFWMLFVIALILTELIFGPTYAAISEFGPVEAANFRFPAFEEWRIITMGYRWSTFDLMAIFQWLAGALIRISLTLFLVVEMFGVQKGKKRTWLLIGLFVSAGALSLVPMSDMQFFRLLYQLLIPGQFLWWSTAALLLSLVVWRVGRKRVHP